MMCKNCFSEMDLIYKFWGNTQEPAEELHICPECNNQYEYNEAYGEWWSILPMEDKIEAMEEDSDEDI